MVACCAWVAGAAVLLAHPERPLERLGTWAGVSTFAEGLIPSRVEVFGRHVCVFGWWWWNSGVVLVFDAGSPTNLVPVARFEHSTVVCDGDRGYLVNQAMEVLDITDPLRPVRVANLGSLEQSMSGGPTDATLQIRRVAGRYLYGLAGAGVMEFYTERSLEVIDCLDPTHPVGIGGLPQVGYGLMDFAGDYACAVRNHYLWPDAKFTLEIIDLRDPRQPAIVGSYPLANHPVDVRLAGRVACLLNYDGMLELVDLTDPTCPVSVGKHRDWDLGLTPTSMLVVGNQLYLRGGDFLTVVDITDPRAPVFGPLWWFVDGVPGAWDVCAGSGLAYVATATGLLACDVTQPLAPRLVGEYPWRDTSPTVSLEVNEHTAFLAHDTDGLRILDVGTPGQPVVTGHYVRDGWRCERAVPSGGCVSVLECQLYTCERALAMIDPADPAQPFGRYSLGYPGQVALCPVASNALLVVTCSHPRRSEIQVLSLQKPFSGAPSARLGLGAVEDAAAQVEGGVAYVTVHDWDPSSGSDGRAVLRLFDVSRPGRIVPTGTYRCPTNSAPRALRLSEGLAYLSWVDCDSTVPSGRIDIVDVRDPRNPVLLGRHSCGNPYATAVAGNQLCVSDVEGLHLVGLSNPARPQRLGSWSDPDAEAVELQWHGAWIYRIRSSAIDLFDVRDPHRPFLAATCGTDRAGANLGLVVSGGLVYVAGWGGLDVGRIPGGVWREDGEPHDQAVAVGDSVTLDARLFSFSPVQCQWYQGEPGDTSRPAPGAQSLRFQTPPLWESTRFWARTTVEGETVDSRAANVSVVPRVRIEPAGFWPAPEKDVLLTVAVTENQACLGYAEGGLQVLDVRNPGRPVLLRSCLLGGPVSSLARQNHLVFAATGSNGLQILDVSAPDRIRRMGEWRSRGSTSVAAVEGDLAYVVQDYGTGAGQFTIVSVRDPALPVQIGVYPVSSGYFHCPDIRPAGPHVYLGCVDGMETLDVRDPAHPVRLNRYDLGGDAGIGGIGIHGSLVCAGSWRKCAVLDVSRPAQPALISMLDSAGLVCIGGRYAFVYGWEVTDIFDIANPATPLRVAGQRASRAWRQSCVVDDVLYVADEAGLGINRIVSSFLYLAPPVPVASDNSLELRWAGGAGTKLQSTADIDRPEWRDVPGSEGQTELQLPLDGPRRFYRAVRR